MADKDYAGDVTAKEAWALLADDARATLVDVRTRAEWSWVGVPDLSPLGKKPILLEWQTYPDGALNQGFVEELRASGVDADAPLLFLCRSGARSRAAAIAVTKAGFGKCLNIADGFEGPHDADGHRGTVAGWKAAGMPWQQQ